MESLYVCLFSNGHIKVGRSIDPEGRIAQHADRVACVGIELAQSYIVACVDLEEREQGLINKCVQAASGRNQLEWFTGLDFAQVCRWAYDCATCDLGLPDFSPKPAVRRIRQELGLTQEELARELGCTQGNIGFIERGTQTLMPDMAKRLMRFARERGLVITYDDLYGPA